MAIEAYLITTEIQLELPDGKGNSNHFQALPGTIYIPSERLQVVRHSENGETIVEYNIFDYFPGCSLRAELAAILEYAPRDSFRKMEVNETDIRYIHEAYHQFGRVLEEITPRLFHSRQK